MPENEPKLPAPRELLFSAADRAKLPEESMRHPYNPASEIHGHTLSRRVGLKRLGVNLIRVPPGKESFVYHLHHAEEEWVWVLSGKGVADVGDESFEIGPGDFLGFPPSTHAHHIRNPGAADLVYLCGGESRDVEVADFPRLGRRMTSWGRTGMLARYAVYPMEAEIPFWKRGQGT